MGPTIVSWRSKKYDTKYGLRLLPIGGFVSMEGEDDESESENAFGKKSVWKRMLIVAAGPVMNLLLGFLLMTVLVFSQEPLVGTTIAEFTEEATSNQLLQVGDEIVRVDGVRVHTGNDMVYEIMNQGYEPIEIEVIRDGKKMRLEGVTFPTMEDSGVTFGNYDFYVYAEPTNLPNLLKHAWFRSISTVKMVYDSLFGLLSGRYGMEAVSGPVGTGQVIGDAVEADRKNENSHYLLYLCSLITINLGLFNLLPIPALDGGRLFFQLIELIRRKPINRKYEGYIHAAGMVLLLLFMVFITFKDIIKLFA
jgi:regulator of sigma E protease